MGMREADTSKVTRLTQVMHEGPMYYLPGVPDPVTVYAVNDRRVRVKPYYTSEWWAVGYVQRHGKTFRAEYTSKGVKYTENFSTYITAVEWVAYYIQGSPERCVSCGTWVYLAKLYSHDYVIPSTGVECDPCRFRREEFEELMSEAKAVRS